MAETVRVCKDNINTALESINRVADGITEAEDVAEILIERRAMINSEFEVYIKSMTRCRELITYFEGDLAYFKDSYAIAEKLKGALKNAVEECAQYLEANIKKLLDMSNKKYMKRFRSLLKVLEVCSPSEDEFKKYLKLYIDHRRSKLKSIISDNESIDLQNGRKSTSTESYQRGMSHPAISHIQECAKAIEEEMLMCQQVFEGDLGGYTPMSVACKVTEKIINKIAQAMNACEFTEENMVSFMIAMDLMETLHEQMPKTFLQLIKIKDLPLKKVVEQNLLKSSQLIVLMIKTSQNLGEADEPQQIIPRIQYLVSLMSDISLFPKSYKMIEFVNKSVKDESKRIYFYNELVTCIQLVESQREQYKKKYSLKFQFVLNNYGFIYSKLSKCQALFGLAGKEESVIGQIKESLEFHGAQFGQYIWKEVRQKLKEEVFGENGKVVQNIKEVSDEIAKKMDQTIRKDFKKYQIDPQLSIEVKNELKIHILKALIPSYSKYLKAVKPEKFYTNEDIELSVEKLLKYH